MASHATALVRRACLWGVPMQLTTDVVRKMEGSVIEVDEAASCLFRDSNDGMRERAAGVLVHEVGIAVVVVRRQWVGRRPTSYRPSQATAWPRERGLADVNVDVGCPHSTAPPMSPLRLPIPTPPSLPS